MEEQQLKEILGNMLITGISSSDIPSPDEYQYWSDRNNRTFYIDYEIGDDYALVELAKAIISINRADKDTAVEDLAPIKIFIMSYGGDLDQANFFCDLIQSSRTPVHTIATGAAMSAGLLILLSGHKRYAFSHSQMLIHQGSASFTGTASETDDAHRAYKRQLDDMKQYVLSHSKITEKLYNSNKKRDWYLSAEKCVEYGVIDEIVTDIITIL